MESKNNPGYSVLMSVYIADTAKNLRESIDSMLAQTIKPDDFVIVCDGPLNQDLYDVIDDYAKRSAELFQVIKLPTNVGLGNALNHGMKACRNEVIVRMDSDDISYPDRVAKQLKYINEHDIVGGGIAEFKTSIDEITGMRVLPESQAEILKFSRKRNPFNHPAIMYKKSAVISADGYSEEYHLFEDYHLWIKMLENGASCINISDPVVHMRVDDNTYIRRGGLSYTKDMLRFHKWLLKTKWSTPVDFLTGAVPHAVVCIIPGKLRKAVYKLLHR